MSCVRDAPLMNSHLLFNLIRGLLCPSRLRNSRADSRVQMAGRRAPPDAAICGGRTAASLHTPQMMGPRERCFWGHTDSDSSNYNQVTVGDVLELSTFLLFLRGVPSNDLAHGSSGFELSSQIWKRFLFRRHFKQPTEFVSLDRCGSQNLGERHNL